jgi:uncharacterized membrane protein
MTKSFLLLLAIALLGCATPKYSYYFDHYDYNSGKKAVAKSDSPNLDPISTESLTASSDVSPSTSLLEKKTASETNIIASNSTAPSTQKSVSKETKKQLRADLKQDIKTLKKAVKKGDHEAVVKAKTELDHDLKLAIIFGAVGLVLSLFGGISSLFWILSVIAIIVAIVFLVRWLLRQ